MTSTVDYQDFNSLTTYLRDIDLRDYLGTGFSYSYEAAKATQEETGAKELDMSLVKGEHLSIYAMVGIYLAYSVLFWCVFLYYKTKLLKTMSEKSAYKITLQVVSTMNAVVCVFFFFHFYFVSCKLPGETFLTNSECFDWCTPAMEIQLICCFCNFSQDYFIIQRVYSNTPLLKQTMFHHIIAVVGLASALIFRRLAAGIALAACLTEVSTIFLNFRSIMMELGWDKDVEHKRIFFFNSVVFAVTFLFTRVIYMSVFILFYMLPAAFSYDYLAVGAQIGYWKLPFLVITILLFTALYGLNLFWFTKIVSGLRRLAKKQDEADDEYIKQKEYTKEGEFDYDNADV